MINTPAATRYAKALFLLAVEQNALDRFVLDVRSVGETVASSPELLTILANPTIPPATRHAVMDSVTQRIGILPIVRNAVLLVTDHGRGTLLPRIAERLAELVDVQQGRVRAEVTSATALSDAQYIKLTQSLEKLTGKRIALTRKVDANLIGGVVTRVGDVVYDGSVRARLGEVRETLLPA